MKKNGIPYVRVKGHLEPNHLKSSPLFTFLTKLLGQNSPSVYLFSITTGSRFTAEKIKLGEDSPSWFVFSRSRFTSLLIKKRDLSVCPVIRSAMRWCLTLIIDSDRGHIFRKHRHKNNKKVAVIYEKMVKNRLLPGYLPASCYADKERVRI